MSFIGKSRSLLNKRLLGSSHEARACKFLKRQGLRLIKSNFHCRRGEIDLIMQDSDNTLVFIEVRFRQNSCYGNAAETVGRKKQERIRTSASLFLHANPGYRKLSCRFDVVGISPRPSLEASSEEFEINLIRNAFF